MRQIGFGEKRSYDDWGLILTKQEIGMAEVVTNYLEIPYRDGAIDLTDAIRGEPTYKMRQLSFEFDLIAPQHEWAKLKRDIAAAVHGRKMQITDADDLDYYYNGRVQLDRFENEGVVVKIRIIAECEPYRYKKQPTIVQKELAPLTTTTLFCHNSRKTVVPTFHIVNVARITFGDQTNVLTPGSYQLTGVQFKAGFNEVTIESFAARAVVTIEYQEGDL